MQVNRTIDHTLLKPTATEADIRALVAEAIDYQFYSVCVNPVWVKLASDLLLREPVAVCTVIGFPLGASAPAVKAYETMQAIEEGADEVDMVINIGALKARQLEQVVEDIKGVVQAAKDQALVKVIIETCLLSDEEIVLACQAAQTAGADFVKTSTGFSTAGAQLEDVVLMRQTVGPEMGVKASGGIHSYKEAIAMLAAGATRLGTSASIQIVQGE